MRVIAWGTLLILAGPALQASAQVPAGTTFQVNTYTTGRQAYARNAMGPRGDFMVVWDSGPVGVSPNLHAQRFTADGASVGGEFRVNVTPLILPAIFGDRGLALSARGDAVVTWSDFGPSSPEIFARRVSAAGVPLGGDFQINQTTTGEQRQSSVAVAPDGRFVVVWDDGGTYDVLGRRFDAFGNALGAEFRVNTYTTGRQGQTDVAIDAAGNFTVVWTSYGQDAVGIFAQRFAADGARLGSEFPVNTHSPGVQYFPSIAMNADGRFVVAWEGAGPGIPNGVSARLFDRSGAPIGVEFAVAQPTSVARADVAMDEPGNFVVSWAHYYPGVPQLKPVRLRRFAASGTPRGAAYQAALSTADFAEVRLASDAVGNFVVSWQEFAPGAADHDVFAQRFGGLLPAGLGVNDGVNGVLEVGDNNFELITAWRNTSGATLFFQGHASALQFPAGLNGAFLSSDAIYGTVPNGAVASCGGPCFGGLLIGTRPAGHVDGTFLETIAPEAQGQTKRWRLHVGDSFSDVPRSSPSYRFVETLLHRGVTAGCGPSLYCPAASTTRDQMAVFLLLAKEASTYAPPACTTPLFADVPASSPFCAWVEELARRGVTGGCAPGLFCPTAAVTREQMAVFLLRTLDPTLNPPACTTPVFADVPASSPFCRWIEELARRGITAGCGGGNYCPADPVTREQMSVFLTGTFGLTLYGP